jgi:precorrin-2/cobalt-factor-2 C20-methyltransferase
MVRDRDALRAAWDVAARRVLALLEEGDVAFLTLGDASLYSTWTYLRSAILAIAPDQAVNTVPGITSFAAAAARSGRALAEGDQALIVVPWAVSDERPWLSEALASGASAAFLKVADRLPALDAALRSTGRTDSVLVSRATLPEEAVSFGWQAAPAAGNGYLSVVLSSAEVAP